MPQLRQELILYPGINTRDGAPTWNLHDPVRNTFYKIGEKTYEILSHWHDGEPEEIINKISQSSLLNVSVNDIAEVVRFLQNYSLTQSQGAEGTQILLAKNAPPKNNWANWLLKNYLFIRIPLLQPDRFLAATYPYISWMYEPWARWVLVILGVFGFYLVGRQWDLFTSSLVELFNWQGMLWFVIAISITKIIHELGHAYTAHRHGCRVSTMGLAFLVMWPVLYTDVTDAWKLPSSRGRMAIASAGMIAEISVAILATLLWSFIPESPIRSAVFLVATTTWLGTLAVNAMPFLRFDGYYLLSDYLRIENLFDRSFALGRWHLREILFGLNRNPPEHQPSGMRHFLIGFSYFVWIYRFFLFLGIAALVYFYFFKLLGLILFTVEIWWFICRPIFAEINQWWSAKNEFRVNLHIFTTLTGIGFLILMFFLPWRTSVEAPAILSSKKHIVLYAPRSAQIQELRVDAGDRVDSGDVVALLSQPSIDYKINRAKSLLQLLEWEVANSGAVNNKRGLIAFAEFRSAQQKLKGLQKERSQLVLKAPFSGIITKITKDVHSGQWVDPYTALIEMVSSDEMGITGYLPESELWRVAVRAEAMFYSDQIEREPIRAVVSDISLAAIQSLSDPELASIYGGPISVHTERSNSNARNDLIPDTSFYRITLSPVDKPNDMKRTRIQSGIAVIAARPESLAQRIWRNIIRVVIRESGF